MTNEVWKPIKGYEGRYEVSNLGNVRSLPVVRYQPSSHKDVMMYKRHPGKKLTPTENGHGYLLVGLYDGGKGKNHYIHRLVAEAFVNNPDNLPNVNHKDFNRSNNSADNLEWVTQKENTMYSSERMSRPKRISKKTMTGEKYITVRCEKYRFSIRNKKVRFDGEYNTIEEAIKKRNAVLADAKYLAG